MSFVPFDPETFCYTVLAKKEGLTLLQLLGGSEWIFFFNGFFQGACRFSECNFQLLMKYQIREKKCEL